MIKDYENICNDLAYAFAIKQGFDFEGWVADRIGGVAWFGDYVIDLSDIYLDIKHDVKKGVVLEWFDANMENEKFINYRAYLSGARHGLI